MLDGQEFHSASGGEMNTTNNRMELRAVIAALVWIAKSGPFPDIELHSDSTYCVQGCNDWRHNWKKRNWMKGGASMPNADLWLEVDRLLNRVPMKLHWVRGHSGVEGNAKADHLATKAIATLTRVSGGFR
jgi:ribonuclease HI